jgi:ABC-type nitrate/sulfonate/bicarbonate transport system ATPase subunit
MISNADSVVLRLEHVSHAFGPLPVLDDVSLQVAPGEFVAVVGPSGSGKTTLLNLLAVWETPTRGQVTRTGKTRTIHQEGGLLPWLTVERNIALGLREIRDRSARDRELYSLLALIGMENFRRAYPHQLSGGMRQRVELARALAGTSGDVLLMDEPFSALDYLTRLKMRRELARLLVERPRTVVLVTHDIEEACQLADRVLVLSERPARIRQEVHLDTPRPRDPTHPQVVEAVENLLGLLGLRDEGVGNDTDRVGTLIREDGAALSMPSGR